MMKGDLVVTLPLKMVHNLQKIWKVDSSVKKENLNMGTQKKVWNPLKVWISRASRSVYLSTPITLAKWRKIWIRCWLVWGHRQRRTQKSPWLVCPGMAILQESPMPETRGEIWSEKDLSLIKEDQNCNIRFKGQNQIYLKWWTAAMSASQCHFKAILDFWEVVAAGKSGILEERGTPRVFKKDKETGSLVWKFRFTQFTCILNNSLNHFRFQLLQYFVREGKRKVKSEDFRSSTDFRKKRFIWSFVVFVT